MSDAPPPVHPGAVAGGDGPLTPDRIDALLADFRAWLEAGGTVEPVEPVGLLTLAREVTALRHEVHLQTKAARAAVEKLGEPPDPKEVRRPLVQALVDVYDVLRLARDRTRGTVSFAGIMPGLVPPADPPAPPRRSWLERVLVPLPQPPTDHLAEFRRLEHEHAVRFHESLTRGLNAVADGYELTIRRVDRALAAAGLEPIPAVGEPFDPQTMEAVDLGDGHDKPAGTVLAESRRGYRWHGEVFRFAQVTVAR